MKRWGMKYITAIVLGVQLIGLLAGCQKSISYNIIFDSCGGSEVKIQTIKSGEHAEKPDDPVKSGFTFVEWQYNEAAYDFNTPVTNNITLIATYSINEGTEIVLVMLDAQNGSSTNIIEIQKGSSMTAPVDPQKQGYKFSGWYLDEEKYDFSSSLTENITLTAKWVTDESSQTSNKNNPINTSTNSMVNSDGTAINSDNTAEYDSITNKYLGRWYLNGYSDVCIDVSRAIYYGAMSIHSYNFSFPCGDMSVKPYVIYPYRYIDPIKGGGWSAGIEIIYDKWDSSLKENKVILGSNCIYINNYKFVKTPGIKDKYYDTCYREILGIWYLYNNPESMLKIYTTTEGDFYNSDYLRIDTVMFDLSDFNTYTSSNPAGYVRAEKQEDYDRYGIFAKNGVLTITNNNGTRTFYKTPVTQKVAAISLDSTNISMTVDETRTIKATITPSDAYDRAITWSSSNPSVASVSSSGVVTGVSEGTAMVKATTKDGGYTALCNVTVSITHVKSISLSQTSMDLIIGNKNQLTANITPSNAANKNVAWSSSDASVATVSSTGLVTAISKGTATITVKTDDGGYTAACKVTVKEPPLSVKASIGTESRFTNTSITYGVFAEINALGGSGNYVSYSIKLYYNDTLIGECTDKKIFVTPIRSGTYRADVYVKDSSGNEATNSTITTISY